MKEVFHIPMNATNSLIRFIKNIAGARPTSALFRGTTETLTQGIPDN